MKGCVTLHFTSKQGNREFAFEVLTMPLFHLAALLPRNKIWCWAARGGQLHKENLTQNVWGCTCVGEGGSVIYVHRGMLPRVCIQVLLGLSQAYALHVCICMFMDIKIWFLFIYVFTIRAIGQSSCTAGMSPSAETPTLLVFPERQV